MGKRGPKRTHLRLNITLPEPLVSEMKAYKKLHGVSVSSQLAFARKNFNFKKKPLKGRYL